MVDILYINLHNIGAKVASMIDILDSIRWVVGCLMWVMKFW